jgi:hypothetical protein
MATSIARGQENPPPQADQPNSAQGADSTADAVPGFPQVNGPLTQAGPDTFILLDAQGRPQPVLGMKYEEFIEAWKKLRELDKANQEPRYILKSLRAEGRIDEETALLEVRFDVVLKTTELVALPLGFKDAILRDFEESDPAVQLSYDETRGGYIAWLRSESSGPRVFTLPLTVPLKRDGNKSSLQINVPRALVSELQLDSLNRLIAPAVSDGAVVRLSDRGGEGSRMTVTGIVGDITLGWSAPGAEPTELETVLSVAGQVTTTIDRHSARSEAELRVESFGGQFRQFQLRLPPGAQLVAPGTTNSEPDQPSYKLLPEESGAGSGGGNASSKGQIWIVELAEPSSGPVDVRVVTEQAIGISRQDAPTELAGFEVIGAIRQFGRVTLNVDRDLQLRWNEIAGGRQVTVGDANLEVPDQATLFGFEYYQQPWSLPVQIIPRGTRVAVSPKYRLELFPGEARLMTTLQYQLAGSQEMQFRVKLAGWEVTADPIEPTRLVDPNKVMLWKPDPLLDDEVLEMRLTQPASRRTEITFYARRSLNEQDSELELQLPIPLADSISTGDLVVLAHPSLVVAPNAAQEGLAPVSRTEVDEVPVKEGLLQVATYRSGVGSLLDGLAFSADVSARPGEMEAAIESQMSVGPQRAHIEETISFHAKYRPVSELELSVPRKVLRDPSFRLSLLSGDGTRQNVDQEAGSGLDEVSLEFRTLTVDDEFNNDETAAIIAVDLPQPQLGRFRIRATYDVESDAQNQDTSSPRIMPFLMPVHVPVASQVAAISARGIEQLELDSDRSDSRWTILSSGETVGTDETIFQANEPVGTLTLAFRRATSTAEGRTTVEQMWLQSWCTANARQQRVVYRFRSDAQQITVELPPGLTGREIEVFLDGVTPRNLERHDAQIVVPIDSLPEETQRVLDLRYLEQRGLDPWNELRVELPQLGGDSTFAEVFWHVIVPKNYLILHGPARLARAHMWSWSSNGLRPELIQTATGARGIERNVGQRQPSAGEFGYLYSGFGPPAMFAATVARSEILYLISAALFLSAGLGLLYLPMLRKPPVLFAASLILVGVGAVYPEWLMICAPALAIGAALGLLACLLFALVPKQYQGEATAPTSTAHGMYHSSRENYLGAPAAAASSNAPTVSMRITESNA